jgi:hypothetical protein
MIAQEVKIIAEMDPILLEEPLFIYHALSLSPLFSNL